ncbi:hypothetical protein FHG87_010325 [Trinorchestia longiramus]|nr:hypothetical protein FHG87_010325 [Trinorchestia longiramus]
MEKSVLALLMFFAVLCCASGDKRTHKKSSLIPREKTLFLPHYDPRFGHRFYTTSKLATSQPWKTQSLNFTSTENSYLELRDQNAKEDDTIRASDRGLRERILRPSGVDFVQMTKHGSLTSARTVKPAREDRQHDEELFSASTTEMSPARATDLIQLTCSLQSALGLIVHDTSCAVTAAASASCARLHTRDVEKDLKSPSPDLNFDFGSFDTSVRSAFWKNKGAAGGRGRELAASEGGQLNSRSLPAQWHAVSRAPSEAVSDGWNMKAAVLVRTVQSAPVEDLTLWISAPSRTLKSTNGSHDTEFDAHVIPGERTSLCWWIRFHPAPGWSESLLRVHGLPVEEGRYSAWILTGDREASVAQHAVDVAFSAGQQKVLEVRTVSNERLAPVSAAQQVPQGSEISQDDEEAIFFHSSLADAEDLSTTSDPWRPPVVERPHVSKNMHPPVKIANIFKDKLAFFKQKSSGSNPNESYPFYFGGNGTFSSDTSRELFTASGDISNLIFRDVQSGTHLVRTKRSDDCKECVKKIRLEHEYDATTAIFVLRMSFNCSTEGCCHKCSGTASMQQYQDSISAVQCSSLPISVQSFHLLYPVADAGYISVDSPYSMKLSTGCYLATVDLGEQAHYGFTWLRPHTEPPDLNAWNTTFYLQPRPLQREVQVRWTQPQYPQNFSRYSLQLWYQADRPLNCSGYHTDSGDMMQVQPTPSLPLDEPMGVFEALSPGWYCARVTPLDPRCPRDGCAIRASHAVLLDDPSAPLSSSTTVEYPLVEMNPQATFVAAIIGATIFVVLVTALVAFLRFKWVERARMSTAGPIYHKVSQVQNPPSERPCLLLVWTKRADSKGRHAVAVTALRRLLSTHFVVWDYLDLLSLPPLERDKVLENPAGWLYTAVHNPRVKVVLVSSVGAEQWCGVVQEGCHAEATVTPDTDVATPLDVQLFPYLLQLLLHDPLLVADYSKIFVVRFARASLTDTESTDGGCEGVLGGLVQGLRYSLPSHLALLSSALLGASENQQRVAELSYPSTLLQEFEKACQRVIVPETQISTNFVIADQPLSKANLSNGSMKPHRTSGDELC